MRRVWAAALVLLLLAGCSDPNVTVVTERYSATVQSHNGYVISGYWITENEDGGYMVTVEMARKEG